mgnify:CR=1 FL=1
MTQRAVRYQKRLIEQGKCPHCREVVEINPRTGKPYQFCIQERARRRLHVAMVRANKKQ